MSLRSQLPSIFACPDCKIIEHPPSDVSVHGWNEVRICQPCRDKRKAHEDRCNAMTLGDFIREVVNGRAELDDSHKHYEALYEEYVHDMPYGTAKARDGDPYEWITNALMEDHSDVIENDAEAELACALDQETRAEAEQDD